MLTEDMLRRIQGADYYHDEEETHWPLWRGLIPAILVAWAIIIALAWGYFG